MKPVARLAVAAALVTTPALGAPPAPNDVSPTRVTLHQHDVPLADVVAGLAKDSAVPVVLGDGSGLANGWPHVTVDADGQPFWQVLSDLCDQAHAMISPQYDGKLLLLPTEPAMAGRRVVAGPVLATFRSVEHLNQLTAQPGQADYCAVRVDLAWEPRLAVAFYAQAGAPTVAVDEKGTPLVPSDAEVDQDPQQPANLYRQFGRYTPRERMMGGQQSCSVPYAIRLKVPPGAGRRIAHLSGTAKLWVAGPVETAEITDLAPNNVRGGKAAARAAPKTYPIGSAIRVHLSSYSASASQVQAQITFNRGTLFGEEWDQARLMLMSANVRAINADGTEWGRLPVGQSGYGPEADALTLYPSIPSNANGGSGNGSRPAKLVVEGSVTATEVDVSYDLTDLPLP